MEGGVVSDVTSEQIQKEIRRYVGTQAELLKVSETLRYKELVVETINLLNGVIKTHFDYVLQKVEEKDPDEEYYVMKLSALMIITRALTVTSDSLESDRVFIHMIKSGFLKPSEKESP